MQNSIFGQKKTIMVKDWIEAVPDRWRSREHYVNFQYNFARELFPFYSKYANFKDKKILEVGCGMGGFSVFLAQKGAEVAAVDFELYDKVLKTARKFAERKNVRIDFRLADAQRLDFPDGFFDVIVMNSVVEHLEEPLKVFGECKRVLKPEGKILINFPLFYGPFGGHIDDFIKIPWYHLLPSTIIKKKLRRGNFKRGILTGEHVAEVFGTLNKMTLMEFRKITGELGFKIVALKVSPSMNDEGVRYLRSLQEKFFFRSIDEIIKQALSLSYYFTPRSFLSFLIFLGFAPLAYVPLANEFFASAVTAVIEKPKS